MVATFCVPYKSIYTFFNVPWTWNYVSTFTVYTKNRPLLAILTSFRYPWQVSKKGHSNNFWQFLQNKVIFDGHVFCIDDSSKVTFNLIYAYQNISSLGYSTFLAFYMLPAKSAIFADFNLFDSRKYWKNAWRLLLP